MTERALSIMGTIMLPLGILMILLSVWMLPYQLPGSAERVITIADIGIGTVLAGCGLCAFLWRKQKQ